jgi:DNA replication protein DnaC
MTFDTFDVRGNNPRANERASLREGLRAAQNFAADPDGWLTLCGDTGVGKTHLAVAIAAKQIAQSRQVFFAFVPELLDYLRHTFNPDSKITYDRLFEEVKTAQILVLDDLGKERSSSWAVEKLYQIIVHRHNARLPTIITTMIDFTKEREPIASRVQDPSIGQLINIEAPDYRNKGRHQLSTKRSLPRRKTPN